MFSVKLGLLSLIFLYHTSQLTQAAFLRCFNGMNGPARPGQYYRLTENRRKIAVFLLLCFFRSLEYYQVTPLDQPKKIMPCINPSLPTVVYTFGYRGRSSGPATKAVLTAYITKKKRNVILLDWEDEAKSGRLGIPLGYALSAVPNAKAIGKELGDALMQLSASGLNMAYIHLVGHSLGAHLMGFAGRHIRENGQVIRRITGLDPARALFEGVLALQTGIDRTCAKFVDIIHSDPGGYGVSTSCGTVDIWPNYARNGGSQPGCAIGDFDMFTPEDLCSHDRSWRYFVEALGAPTSFPCAAAENYEDWIRKEGRTDQKIYLGDLTSTRAKGNFFLNTHGKFPYGMGEEGMMPDDNQIRKRRNPTLTKILRYFR